ncbi:MAG: peptidoglycan-binding protein [Deltaproteobacteria bacterium]|nr:peptidoglycan-binding protein [Deltaproteobacteria bacterium]
MKRALLYLSAISAAGLCAAPVMAQQQSRQQQPQSRQQVSAGAQLFVSPTAVVKVQKALQQKGYDLQQVDGVWGPNTEQALVSFQQESGLEPTGNINLRTLAALELGQAILGNDPIEPQIASQIAEEPSQISGAPLYAAPKMVRMIEVALHSSGYDVGNIDGVWDQDTSDAAYQFQQDSGLEPTGKLNLRTIGELGLGQTVMQLSSNRLPESPRARFQGTSRQQPRQQLLDEESVKGVGAPIYISPEGVRQVQQALKSAGYQSVKVTGDFDRQTAKAVRSLQEEKGLEPTGNLNMHTINELGLSRDFIEFRVSKRAKAREQQASVQSGQQMESPSMRARFGSEEQYQEQEFQPSTRQYRRQQAGAQQQYGRPSQSIKQQRYGRQPAGGQQGFSIQEEDARAQLGQEQLEEQEQALYSEEPQRLRSQQRIRDPQQR